MSFLRSVSRNELTPTDSLKDFYLCYNTNSTFSPTRSKGNHKLAAPLTTNT